MQIIKVTGESLSPFFRDGDYVLVAKFPFLLKRIKPGDILVFRHPLFGTMIKRLERLSPDGEDLFVVGEDAFSNDSRRFGPIRRADLVGKVVWHSKASPEVNS
jgi:nickel-type superoxide dismutase maturation protease